MLSGADLMDDYPICTKTGSLCYQTEPLISISQFGVLRPNVDVLYVNTLNQLTSAQPYRNHDTNTSLGKNSSWCLWAEITLASLMRRFLADTSSHTTSSLLN